MGRQRLYHTSDEKLAANRAKSKRHYDRKREGINEQRRKQYRKRHPLNSSTTSPSIQARPEESTTERALRVWLEHASWVKSRMEKITSKAPATFLEQVYGECIANGDSGNIQEYATTFLKFQRSIYRYENEVLSLAGVGPEYNLVREISKQVCQIVGWVNELLCHASISIQEVKEVHDAQELAYQSS
ncbi:hypothetical protein BDZ97DRAFT_1770997 [Flammula alnicola]|nr:hypothetical protein BDZ97DRAFT_1770997 [Flammula alnicola]